MLDQNPSWVPEVDTSRTLGISIRSYSVFRPNTRAADSSSASCPNGFRRTDLRLRVDADAERCIEVTPWRDDLQPPPVGQRVGRCGHRLDGDKVLPCRCEHL